MLPLDLEIFSEVAGWKRLPQNLLDLNIQATAADSSFPGALLPVASERGHIFCYAAVSSATEWRRLRPLLLAYAGPTITNFNGMRRSPNPVRPIEQLIANAGAVSVAPLVPPNEGALLAFKALQRLIASFGSAPKAVTRPPAATSVLLSQFDMCIAAGDRSGAETLLSTLQREWRLDPLNLRFAELRLLAAFDDWTQLTLKPWFDDLCRATKPPAVAHMLLEAIWHTKLAGLATDETALTDFYKINVRPLCVDLLEEVPNSREGGAARICAIETALSSTIPSDSLAPPLSPTETNGWIGWTLSVSRGAKNDLATLAREAALQQPAATILHASEATEIAQHFEILANEGKRDAVLAAIPVLITWLRDDPGFPRLPMLPLYDLVVTLFAYLEDRGQAARDALLIVLDAALSVGMSSTNYRRLLQDAEEFVDEEAGTATVYWLMELAELLIRHPGKDPGERHRLLIAILTSMRPVLPLLTPGQRVAYSRIALTEGWDPLPSAPVAEAAESLAGALNGKLIAIYTLTEAAGRQAGTALAELAPDARVEMAADHVCSPRLQSLSRNADLFVVATSSAKHAATECIQRHRAKGAPVLYAAGRGVSSILRAIEDYALGSAGSA